VFLGSVLELPLFHPDLVDALLPGVMVHAERDGIHVMRLLSHASISHPDKVMDLGWLPADCTAHFCKRLKTLSALLF